MDRRQAQKLAAQIIERAERSRRSQMVFRGPSGAYQVVRPDSAPARNAEKHNDWIIGVYSTTARFDWIVDDLLEK